MKKVILLIASFIIIANAFSQQNTFSKVLYQSKKDIEGFASIPSPDNGYLVVGSLDWKNGMAVKVDEQGTPVWNKVYSFKGVSGNSLKFNKVITTFDSSYIMVGEAYDVTAHKYNGIIFKINMQGDTLWVRTIIGDNNLKLYSVCQTSDSGYVVTGNTDVYQNTSIDKLFVAKLSRIGTLQWAKEYSSNHHYTGTSIKEADDQSLFVTGYSVGGDFSFLLKMSGQGNVVWAKQYHVDGDYMRCMINDFLQKENGFTLLVSMKQGPSLVFVDSTGNFLNCKNYLAIYGLEINPEIHPTNDGGYVFVSGDRHGGGNLIKTDSLGNLSFSDDIFDGVVDVVQTDSLAFFITASGPIYWVKRFEDYPGEIGFIQVDSLGYAGDECAFNASIQVENDSLISEPASFTSVNKGQLDNMSILVDSINILSRPGCVDMVGSVNENRCKNSIKISPNPTTGKITIILTDVESGNIIFYNGLGKQVLMQKLSQPQTDIDLSNREAGIYLYKFITKDNRTITGKIVLSQ